MSIKITSLVWKRAPYRGVTFTIFLALADYANEHGGGIYPRVETLAVKARCSKRRAQEAVDLLLSDGMLRCVERATGKPGKANVYCIEIEKLESLPDLYSTNAKKSNKGGTLGHRGAQFGTRHIEEPSGEPSFEPTPTPQGDVRERLDREEEFVDFLNSGGFSWKTAPLDSTRKAWSAIVTTLPDRPTFASCVLEFWRAHEAEETRFRRKTIPIGPARFLREGQWRRYLPTTDAGSNDVVTLRLWNGHPAGAQLAKLMKPAELRTWFGDTSLEVTKSEVTISFPNPFRAMRARQYEGMIALAFNVPAENVRFIVME